MMRTKAAGELLLAAVVVLITAACDSPRGEGGDRSRRARDRSDGPTDVVIWGCERAIPINVNTLDPRWREESIVVGDFGFNLTADDFSGFRRHKRATIEVKLPVTIEGHSGATVWVPRHERDRVALALANVPRSGPGNSYRIEDAHHGIHFEPCTDKKWSAWTAGLVLADRREIVLEVRVDGAPRPTRVILGPWEVVSL